jgi:hypothetical protein
MDFIPQELRSRGDERDVGRDYCLIIAIVIIKDNELDVTELFAF